VVGDVILNAFFQGSECRLVARGPQLGQVRFREVLVGVANVLWRVDEGDLRRFSHGAKRGVDEVEEGAALTAAKVVQPGVGRDAVVHEVQQDTADVLHMHEIPGLVAILEIGTVAPEELHASR